MTKPDSQRIVFHTDLPCADLTAQDEQPKHINLRDFRKPISTAAQHPKGEHCAREFCSMVRVCHRVSRPRPSMRNARVLAHPRSSRRGAAFRRWFAGVSAAERLKIQPPTVSTRSTARRYSFSGCRNLVL